MFFRALPLVENRKQTCNGSKKGNPFHERRGEDHVGPNFVRSFRLAGDAFHGAFTNLTDTDTCAYGRKTRTDSTVTGLSYICQKSYHQRHNTWFFIIKKPFNSLYHYRFFCMLVSIRFLMPALKCLPDKERGEVGKNISLDKDHQDLDQVNKDRQQNEERRGPPAEGGIHRTKDEYQEDKAQNDNVPRDHIRKKTNN